jgi:hypothetical protein
VFIAFTFLFSLNAVMVFSSPAAPKDFIISEATSNLSGSAAFPRPSLQGRNRFVFLLNSSLIPNRNGILIGI